MYEKITAENPYETPMMIYPAVHYTMGGLWVDYNLMSTIDGLFVLGEANFSDHGANRLGASALMQGLADGYFRHSLHHRRVPGRAPPFPKSVPNIRPSRRPQPNPISGYSRLLAVQGKRTVDDFHKALGNILWEHCGMSRNNEGLEKARELVRTLRAEFWENVKVPGTGEGFNQSLERAGRVADFLEFAELLLIDARTRQESCGGHFNEAFQTDENEALRDDENFCHVAAWEYAGPETRIRSSTRNRWHLKTYI